MINYQGKLINDISIHIPNLVMRREMKMKSKKEIINLIAQLENHIADDLEGQDLDFKQWDERSLNENIQKMIKYAVCMANGGGGSVVFGIADKVRGIENVLKGVPLEFNVDEIEKIIYENTIPHITPIFDEIYYQNQTIRILIMHVLPGKTLYTTLDGTATIRKGKECLPYHRNDF